MPSPLADLRQPPMRIAPMGVAELGTALDWAAAEGWNPGLDDASAFLAADPRSVLMGWVGDEGRRLHRGRPPFAGLPRGRISSGALRPSSSAEAPRYFYVRGQLRRTTCRHSGPQPPSSRAGPALRLFGSGRARSGPMKCYPSYDARKTSPARSSIRISTVSVTQAQIVATRSAVALSSAMPKRAPKIG
jgi:hypothetical protein